MRAWPWFPQAATVRQAAREYRPDEYHRARATGIPLWLKGTRCREGQPTQVRSAAIDFAYGADRIPCGCLRMSFSTTSRSTDLTASAGSDSGRYSEVQS